MNASGADEVERRGAEVAKIVPIRRPRESDSYLRTIWENPVEYQISWTFGGYATVLAVRRASDSAGLNHVEVRIEAASDGLQHDRFDVIGVRIAEE